MAQLPDVQCWIKLIEQPTGKVVPSGTEVKPSSDGSITIRYVVANDSNKATGNFMVIGTLRRNDENLPSPVPPTTIQLQPKQLWTHEHTVNKSDLGKYSASLLGDITFPPGAGVKEEDESNNLAKAKFSLTFPIPDRKEP
ncbi:MAG TPA: hypothetical protein VD861_17770 [Pyrinomonadaceae bacterium]|nr:hypothetical protein [Pyrinomonadaceae bacterium]